MYLPPHFTESRPELLLQAMQENSFATVVTADGDGPFASHVPVLVDGEAVAGADPTARELGRWMDHARR